MTKATENFRAQLKSGPVYGPFAKTCDPAVIETLGHAGFDFVILDMEHGPNSVETVQNLVRAAELSNILPFVRVPPGDLHTIERVLDVRAAGVQVPQISTAQAASAAVRAARFSPQGERGVCRFVRAADYSSMPKDQYFRQANEALVIIQLEGKEALDNLNDILEVEGIDIIFIGPYDLSQSLGFPGQVDHPKVIETTRRIVSACLEKGIAVGNFTETPQQTSFWTQQGLCYMSFSVDMGLLYESCSTLVTQLRQESASDAT